MDAKDQKNILRLRKELGAPLPIIKDIYLKHTAAGESEDTIIAEIKAERHKIFQKIRTKPMDKTIFIYKQDGNIVRILKCNMQTDYLPRTPEMQEVFYTLLNGQNNNKDDIQESYERLVVLANENLEYKLFEISYDHFALCSFQKGMWSDLIIKGLTTAESMIVIKYEEDKTDIANMVASKIFKYIQNNTENAKKSKIELNDAVIQEIFGDKMIDKYNEIKMTDYEVFFE